MIQQFLIDVIGFELSMILLVFLVIIAAAVLIWKGITKGYDKNMYEMQ